MNARFDPSGPLRGSLRVPADKSISHRAAIVAAMASEPVRVRNYLDAADTRSTLAAVQKLGAIVESRADGLLIRGCGLRNALPQHGAIDVGNAGTLMRLLPGWLAFQPGQSFELDGDDSIRRRPVDRIAEPLSLMGARIEAREGRFPPFTVHGAALRGIEYELPVASAQVKSCVLLAGLGARGDTVVREHVLTRRHTEELLARCGADVTEEGGDGADHVVRLGPSELAPFELDVPGDPSQAAFWIVAACVVPGSEVTVEHVYVGRGRRGYLDVLARMGAAIVEVPTTGPGDLDATADVTARYGPLRGTVVEASEITGLDEVPVLAVAGACASGDTVFRAVGELRVKESDRLAGVAELVRVFGAGAEVDGDDLVVHGTGRLVPAAVDARGDHRMAMAAAVAGLAAGSDPTKIAGWGAVATSYPGFATDLVALSGTR